MLEITKLNKVYSARNISNQHVLKDIHLTINEGEFVSVMGPSGSGKSTLLYTISGMDNVTSGSVRFNKQELSMMSEEELAKLRLHAMGFIFQQSNLLSNLTIFDNIILPAYAAKSKSKQHINKQAMELMRKLGIAALANHEITEVSGGQLQRVAICRALINNPSILFGDEPTGALNTKGANDVMDILTTLHRSGTTIMLVTHDVKVAARTERVLFMLDGEIVAEKQFGKITNEEIKEREEKLIKWISTLGG